MAKYRSAFSLFLLAAAAGCADPAARVTTVSVGAHELPGCPLPDRGPQDPSPFRLTLMALGNFPESGFDVETDIGLDDTGLTLAFDSATTGIDAVARDSPTDTAQTFVGHTERRRDDDIDVLLWPEARACPVSDAADAYPGAGAGQGLGYSAEAGLVLAAGESADDQRSGSAFTFDTERGTATPVSREHGTLRVSRSFATVTAFGDALLVAGGTNPSEASSPEDAPGTAEIFDPTSGGFDPTLVELWSRRTHHAALTLPTTGETLLVGGVAPDSASSGPGQLIHQLEAVSPVTKSSSISDLKALDLGRMDPTALVLENGRLLVGGGHGTDGTPVGEVEFFSPDAQRSLFYAELPERKARSFAPLPGGGVLSVASCDDDPSTRLGDCTCIDASGASCTEGEQDAHWLDAWWIDSDGTPAPVALVPGGGLTPCPTPAAPLLVTGSDGAPWLVSVSDGATPGCLFRFEAWPEDAPSTGDTPASTDDPADRPRFVATTITLDPPPDPRSPPLVLAPDAFVWIAAAGGLYGARLGHRGPLTRDDVSLLASDPSAPFRPQHLVPDRDPRLSQTTAPDGSSPPAVAYDHGELSLAPATPPVTLWAADTLYDDVLVSLAVEPAADGSVPVPPLLTFASNTADESVACAWPAPLATDTASLALTAARHDGVVTLTTPGVDPVTCAAPAGSVAVGVTAGGAPVTLSEFALARSLLE
ncbi:MAG TPA: hypothetical protein VMI54_27825 [Polyangiaceae bacterium]|nr:hypothetical protein [Polyangiaceae bacterium]